MSKKQKRFESYIFEIINEHTSVLLLQRHTFEVKCGCVNKDSIFECTFNYPYLNVTIGYSKSAFKKWRKGVNLTTYIVHEMCHPITDPLYSKALDRYASRSEIHDERELLTDYICNIALNSKLRR